MVAKYKFGRSLGMLTMQISSGVGRCLVKGLKEKGYNIEPSAWSVISLLLTYPNRTQQEIADFLWLNKVKVKRLLDNLEKEGLLKREILDSDKRYNVVNLTQKGIDLYNSAVDCADDALAKAYIGFNEDEENLLIDMLIRAKENLTEKDKKFDKKR
jgi:DNA-binding MarR family transcriptional regulator